MSLSLQTIQRHQSLYEQAYHALRANILSGELAAGERMVETRLAKKLQVSRTPIREAMRQLQRESLLVADTNGGLRVATVSASDASQLYDCRLALEQLAIRETCDRINPKTLKKIEACVLQAEELQEDGRYELMLQLDYRFHKLIAQASDNRWLVSLLDRVFDQMMLLRVQTTRHNPRVLEIRQEHRIIFEAIAQRDGDKAVQVMVEHLQASKIRTIRELQNLFGSGE
ncbi:MAG: GntR family transcriptional regulator [Microcoleaceae cyanobacterium]